MGKDVRMLGILDPWVQALYFVLILIPIIIIKLISVFIRRHELQKLTNQDINFYQVFIREKYNFDNVLDMIQNIVKSGNCDV